MRMADVLKPQNVWEIVDFGLDNEQYAVQAGLSLACNLIPTASTASAAAAGGQAVAETFVQLQRQTTPAAESFGALSPL